MIDIQDSEDSQNSKITIVNNHEYREDEHLQEENRSLTNSAKKLPIKESYFSTDFDKKIRK